MRWSVIVLFFLLAGCRHQAYTLARQGRSQMLTPPPTKPDIRSARKHPGEEDGCDIQAGSFSVAWRGNTARVAVKTETYFAPSESAVPQRGTPGVTIAESGPRMYSDALGQIEKFRDAVTARENAGCLTVAEAARLRQSITEKFPFPPQIAAYLRFGTYTQTGAVDLIPGFELRVVSPTGGDPDVSFYDAAGVPGSDRARITLASGAGKALTIPDTPGYYRYLYFTGASAHNFRTTILGAPDRGVLRDATAQFLFDPEGFCARPTQGVFCQSIAPSVGMNVGFPVRVNGREEFVRIGGSIGEVLGEARNGLRPARRPQPLPQNVKVRRIYRGKRIPVRVDGASNDIFGLIAMPGDEITASISASR